MRHSGGFTRHIFNDFDNRWRHKVAATPILISLLNGTAYNSAPGVCQEQTDLIAHT
jgi:hypothetical protein